MKPVMCISTFTGFAIALSMLFHPVKAQENIEVSINPAQMSKGTQPCYSVTIPQAELKSVQQGWIKKLQENNKAKVKESGQELIFAGGLKAEIAPDSVNIYTLLVPTDSSVTLNLFIEIDSVFFSPKEDKTDLASDKTDNNIRVYVRSFAVDQYRLAVENELENEQKTLKTMQNDLEKLQKDEKNLKNDNVSLESEIESTEREITEIDQNILLKNQEIFEHNASTGKLALEADKKAALDKQKDLEKEKNQLEKSKAKAKEKVSDDKSEIKKNEKAITESEEQQALKQEEITKQNEVILKVQTKLNGIK